MISLEVLEPASFSRSDRIRSSQLTGSASGTRAGRCSSRIGRVNQGSRFKVIVLVAPRSESRQPPSDSSSGARRSSMNTLLPEYSITGRSRVGPCSPPQYSTIATSLTCRGPNWRATPHLTACADRSSPPPQPNASRTSQRALRLR